MHIRVYASDSLKSLCRPERVSNIIYNKDIHGLGLLSGVLGAISKGGKTVPNDEKIRGRAEYYFNVLHGKNEQPLKDSDFNKMSELVRVFLKS